MKYAKDRQNGPFSIDKSKYIQEILKAFSHRRLQSRYKSNEFKLKSAPNICPKSDEERKKMLKVPYQKVRKHSLRSEKRSKIFILRNLKGTVIN